MFMITDLRCEYKQNPIGLNMRQPRISWKLRSDARGTLQAAYRLVVAADDRFNELLWDSGRMESDRSTHVVPTGLEMASKERYYYRVQAWNIHVEYSGWEKAENGRMPIRVTIPANTTAEIVLPGATLETARENGVILEYAGGISNADQCDEGVRLEAGSGDYRFEYEYTREIRSIRKEEQSDEIAI